MKRTGWILSFCLLAISCLDQPDCYNLTNNTVTVLFRKIFDGKADTVNLVEGKVVEIDSVFYSLATVKSSLSFPINYLADSTTLSIKDTERTNLLKLGYRVQSQFVSEECGPRFVLSNLSILTTTADSARIASSTPGQGTNVNLYRCPRVNVVRIAFRQSTTDGIVKDTVKIISTNADDQPTYPAISFYPVIGELSFINLPLDINANTTQFTFEFAEGVKTLNFLYDRIESTAFKVCGTQTFITNLQLTSPDFSTIQAIETTKYKSDSIYDPPKINFAIIQ